MMTTASAIPSTTPRPSPHWRSTLLPPLLANLAVWTAVAGVHAASVWSDALRRGRAPDALDLLGGYLVAYAPWVLLGATLHVLHRHTARPWRGVLLVSFVFLILELVYQAVLIAADTGLSPASVVAALRDMPMIFRLIDLALLLATNAVAYAVVAVRTQRDAAELERRLHADNLQLRLELEQQRLQGLRAQLEPHFLYNALNAISGLVRSDDRGLALTALQQLSRLLRYATTAVSRDWVPLSDEIAFLQEYLALQQLRFGARLEVVYEGLDNVPSDQESPPLLLQPLAENAVRHGLETSDAASRIRVRIETSDDVTTVLVSNSVPADAAPNPGLGVGLGTLRDRLAVAYHGRATLTTVAATDRFDVHLSLPLQNDD
ncbi:MAG: histidine kinase [Gemmatimonadaceae bacterium]|nr:histidine kinase [Gemmatimonadaceae bacterium]